MTWVRLDDQWADHPKFADVPDLAQLVWVKGLTHCSRYLTDGFIKDSVIPRLLKSGKASRKAAAELVQAGLWEVVPGGCQVHDYSDYQPLAAQVKAQRSANRERVKRFRNAGGNGVTPGITNDDEMPLARTRARVGTGSGSGSAPEGSAEGGVDETPESVEPVVHDGGRKTTYDTAWRLWRELYEASRRGYGRYVEVFIQDDRVVQRLAHRATELAGGDAERTVALLRHWFLTYLRDDGDVNCQANARHPLRLLERRLPTYGDLPKAASVTRIKAAARAPEPPPVSNEEHLANVERARNIARGIGDPRKGSA